MIQVGKPVKGNDLIGREEVIKEILAYLNMGQSVVLLAPRRFGKTSVIIELLSRLKAQKKYTGFVDIFEHGDLGFLGRQIIEEVLDNHKLKKAYKDTKGSIRGLLSNIKLKAVIEEFEFILALEDSTVSDKEIFNNSIDFINDFAERNKKDMVFAFDEFGDMLKFGGSAIIKALRAKIQQQDSATYIFSGSYESVMDSLFV